MSEMLENGELYPYSQTIVNKSGVVVGCEILMRWHHNEKIIYPDEFISLAESSKLIFPMTIEIIRKVYDICRLNPFKFPNGYKISINICATHLLPPYATELLKICSEFSRNEETKHIQLILEITETESINKTSMVHDLLSDLHDLNIKVFLDDFGTKYSNLENILYFNVDGIKIDKMFTDSIFASKNGFFIIDSIISLAKRLNIIVVVEGVENKEQADFLINNDVDYLQGYFYGKPILFGDF
ncbi:EAL domain-containing protein [Vibrio sp. E150_018]